MYRLIRESAMPKFLKFLLYAVLTLTCVYLIGLFLYKFLELVRKGINGITKEKGRWWFFLLCCLMIVIASCIALRYNPFVELYEFVIEKIDDLKNNLGEMLTSK